MKIITQNMKCLPFIMRYTKKHGVSRASSKRIKPFSCAHFWLAIVALKPRVYANGEKPLENETTGRSY